MIREFETQALHYLLGQMDAVQRAAFEDKLARYPAARAAVLDCGESLAILRRQALEVPFFGDVVQHQLSLVMQTVREAGRHRWSDRWTRLWRWFRRATAARGRSASAGDEAGADSVSA